MAFIPSRSIQCPATGRRSMVQWLALVLFAVCLSPSTAWAAACLSTNGGDCDGDGMNDMIDPCPAVPGLPPPPPPPVITRMGGLPLLRPASPEEVRYGFQDIA